jgi:hypothetical protein
MGAYTIDSKDERNTHYPQGYIPKQSSTYTPYDQDFLALVPQNPDSYQTFNITITNSVLPTMTSGQHVYFLAQPRLFGLEYTTGQQHLSLRTADGYKPMDSFRNWQLTLPSYALSGMSYDFNKMQFIKYKDKKTIQQCYVDISPDQTFSNYLAPGDKQE